MTSVSWAVSVLTYFVLALAMYETQGHYNPDWVLGFAAMFGAWSVLVFQTAERRVVWLPKPESLAWSIVVTSQRLHGSAC